MEQRIRLKVVDKKWETSRAATLVLEPLPGPVTYRAGQFLTFLFEGWGPEPVRRSYSLSSAPGVEPLLSVTVQRVANGQVSDHLTHKVAVGDVLEALPPAGSFTLTSWTDRPRDIWLIGGGSGITPLFSLLKECLHREPQSVVHLLLANRDEASVIFRPELEALARRFPRSFHSLHYLSNPSGSWLLTDLPNAAVCQGRLSNALIEDLVRRHMQFDPEEAEFFLCGSEGLMLKCEQTLGFMGFDRSRVHREIFTVKTPFRPLTGDLQDSRVQLRMTGGQTSTFTVRAGETILEAAEQQGLHLPFSCRSGICTTCMAQCRKGAALMYTQEGVLDSRTMHDAVLTCVAFPQTTEMVLVRS